MRLVRLALLTCLMFTLPVAANAGPQVGTTFPADFPVIIDASLGVPVIGFGAAGRVQRTPVIFLHGNNDTPFPTKCNPSSSPTTATRSASCGGWATRALSAT